MKKPLMRVTTAVALIVVGAALIALGIGIRYVRHALSEDEIRRVLVEAARDELGADLSIGSVRLGWDRVLRAEDVELTLRHQEQPFVTARSLRVSVDALSLLSGGMGVTRAVLVEPYLRLTHDKVRDRWNFEALSASKGEEPSAPPVGLLPDGIVLEKATIEVTYAELFGDGRPRVYSNVYVTGRPDQANGERWTVDALFAEGPLAGLRATGRIDVGSDESAEFHVSHPAVKVTGDMWTMVPSGGEVWEAFQPEGTFGIEGRIYTREDKSVAADFDVDIWEANVVPEFYPIRMESVSGPLKVTDTGVTMHRLTGTVPASEFGAAGLPDARMTVSGDYRFADEAATVNVSVADVPICRASVQSIPEVGDRIWSELRPVGVGSVALTLRQASAEDEIEFAASARFEDASLRPQALPAPLEHVSGSLTADARSIRLSDLRGILLQPEAGSSAPFEGYGIVDLEGPDTALHVRIKNLQTTEELIKSIPEVGERVWEFLQPEVLVDADVVLGDLTDFDASPPMISLTVRGGRARPRDFGLILTNVAGRVTVRGTRVFIENMLLAPEVPADTGAFQGAAGNIEVSGPFDLETGALDMHVHARDLLLTEELVRAIPEWGEELWAGGQPRGYVSVDGRLWRRSEQDAPHYLVDLSMRDASFQLRQVPIPITSVAGQVLLRDGQIISNDFAGITCGGRIVGRFLLRFSEDFEYPSYAATFDYKMLELADLLARLAPGSADVSGKLSGTVMVGGFLNNPASLSAKGQVTLSEGRLWKNPLLVRLLSILHLAIPAGRESPMQGTADYRIASRQILVQEFDLTGGGLNASGYGTVGFDGTLALSLVAVGAPDSRGIPIVSSVVSWIASTVERQLVRVDVTGTLSEPQFSSQLLSKLTYPLTSLRGILTAPVRMVVPGMSGRKEE